MPESATTIQLRQDTETPLTTLRTPFGTMLYLYARSDDSVHNATIGQDYVTFQYSENNLCFAVCDGVGQSFMGDLAARVLGDGLIRWLWDINRPKDAADFSDHVGEALADLVEAGTKAVESFMLPPTLPPIVKQALEMQRKYGSESMFVAGRISLAPSDSWVALCWLGDSPVAAVDYDGELLDLGPHGHISERWNALTGIKGRAHTWVGDGEKIARVAGYTDGLGVEHVPTDADLARMMAAWMLDPPSDDASLFDVRLAPSLATIGEPEPETLKKLQFEADEKRPIPKPKIKDPEPIIVKDKPRSPVAGRKPLQNPTLPGEEPQSWGALGGQASDDPSVQQIQMWQQAALLGLTSAALAMLMVERLMLEQKDKKS